MADAMKKEFVVNEKTYRLPEVITLRQYEEILGLLGNTLEKLAPNIAALQGQGLQGGLLPILQSFIPNGAIAELLAIILVPAGEERWKKEFRASSYEDMHDLGDDDVLSIVINFFVGRMSLVNTFVGVFTKYINDVKERAESTADSAPAQ